jgi:hypothetical protein
MSTTYRTVIEIRAAPDHILAILRDVERWPEWTSTMTARHDVEPADGENSS